MLLNELLKQSHFTNQNYFFSILICSILSFHRQVYTGTHLQDHACPALAVYIRTSLIIIRTDCQRDVRACKKYEKKIIRINVYHQAFFYSSVNTRILVQQRVKVQLTIASDIKLTIYIAHTALEVTTDSALTCQLPSLCFSRRKLDVVRSHRNQGSASLFHHIVQ